MYHQSNVINIATFVIGLIGDDIYICIKQKHQIIPEFNSMKAEVYRLYVHRINLQE